MNPACVGPDRGLQLSAWLGGGWSLLGPGPRVVDDRCEYGDFDHAAKDVVAPLAESTSDDRDGVHDSQRNIGDSVEPRSQVERARRGPSADRSSNLDEVAAGVVEHRRDDRAHRQWLLRE